MVEELNDHSKCGCIAKVSASSGAELWPIIRWLSRES